MIPVIFKLAFANVRRSYKDFGIYFLTLLVGVAVFYAFNSVGSQSAVLTLNEMQGGMLDVLGMLIDTVSVFIVAILAFLVIYASRFLIKRRNKEFGLYLLLGMTRGKLLALSAVETLFVGAVSLAAGLALGVLLSQALVGVTALLFVADMSKGFTFLFSADAAIKSVVVFFAIFALSLLINVGYLGRAKLIDLVNAEKKNEVMTLRSTRVSLALFIVSLGVIALSYKLLLDNGLLSVDGPFWAATALVSVGTLLFFYSLSGFLLSVLSRMKGFYYRGLNMFSLRQIASRVNSSFASMGVVCLTLFLAITSVCGGIGICTATQQSYESASYDASVRSYLTLGEGTDEFPSAAEMMKRYGSAEAGIRASFEDQGVDWDRYVKDAAEIDLYRAETTYADLDRLAGAKLGDYNKAVEEGYEMTPLSVVKLSQVNRSLELAGKESLELAPGEAILSVDADVVKDYMRDVVKAGGEVEEFGKKFTLSSHLDETCYETTATPMQLGMLIVADDAVPADAVATSTILNVQFPVGMDGDEWTKKLDEVMGKADADAWPVSMWQTRQEVYDQTVGFTTVISYLAIYIGFILVMACAAILAIQQLTAASDNRRRYQMLNKLGAPRRMIDGSLFKQIVIAFIFPLALAVAHSACALTVVTDVTSMFGHVDIAGPALITAAGFLAVYGVYFVLTYFQARSVVRDR